MQEKKVKGLTKRDQALLKKVTKYYLHYNKVIDLGKLLRQITGNIEYDADKESLEHAINGLYYYISYVITKEALIVAKRAWREKLTKREFSNDFGTEIFGELDIPRTIVTYPYRVYSFYAYERGTNAPEFAVLGALLREIYSGVKVLKKELESYYEDTNTLRYFRLKKYDSYLRQLKIFSEKFRKGRIRSPTKYDPVWLKRTYNAYVILQRLVERKIKIGERSAKFALEADEDILKVLLWKLYEIYVFLLVVRYLEERGYEVKMVKHGEHDYASYVAKKGEARLFLVFNAPLHFSSLVGIDDIQDGEKKFKGRPDISLINGKRIIFECKYSLQPSYITQGRFKVMAYMYEYQPDAAVLVYPGLKRGAKFHSPDDQITVNLDNEIRKGKNYIDFRFRTGGEQTKKIYLAIIDPAYEDGEERSSDDSTDDPNLRVIKSILDEVLG